MFRNIRTIEDLETTVKKLKNGLDESADLVMIQSMMDGNDFESDPKFAKYGGGASALEMVLDMINWYKINNALKREA